MGQLEEGHNGAVQGGVQKGHPGRGARGQPGKIHLHSNFKPCISVAGPSPQGS